MDTVVPVVVQLVLITVIGGVFVQNLQHKNWIRQQQISQQEKLISELKSIFVELDALLSRRVYRTRRLLYSLRRPTGTKLKAALKNYDQTITEWNEKRNSFQIRLVRVVSVPLAQEFEHDLSRRFVNIGGQLERIARVVDGKSKPTGPILDRLTELEIELEWLSRSVFEFLRTIYIQLQREQTELYVLNKFTRIPDSQEELESVSTWFLLKSLFIPPSIPGKQS